MRDTEVEQCIAAWAETREKVARATLMAQVKAEPRVAEKPAEKSLVVDRSETVG